MFLLGIAAFFPVEYHPDEDAGESVSRITQEFLKKIIFIYIRIYRGNLYTFIYIYFKLSGLDSAGVAS